jgi:hypothetical protein
MNSWKLTWESGIALEFAGLPWGALGPLSAQALFIVFASVLLRELVRG